MNTITFDTLRFAKRLTEAGMPERQAEVLAEEQAQLIDQNLATKRDLKELELRLTHTLTIRMGGMVAVAVAIVATLVKLL
jgi:hypothetical protein